MYNQLILGLPTHVLPKLCFNEFLDSILYHLYAWHHYRRVTFGHSSQFVSTYLWPSSSSFGFGLIWSLKQYPIEGMMAAP